MAGGELEEAERDPILGAFIEEQIARLKEKPQVSEPAKPLDNLNRFFRANLNTS
jgi:hypothetical protein